MPLYTLHHIYISLIQPYLLYGIVAWGQNAKTSKNKIPFLLKRALRLMFFGDYNSHAVPYFVSSSFLPLDLLYFKSVAIPVMHDIQLFRERLSQKVHATISKGIVGGFVCPVLQRHLKEWHERPRTYVREC